MIREEIRKATLDGKKLVQFPTGETAMKIEGLGENTTWFNNENRSLKPEELKAGDTIYQMTQESANNAWIITNVLEDGKFKAIPKKDWEDVLKNHEGYSGAISKIDTENLAESFDISGKIDITNPIYKFYEKEVGRYLKNNYDSKTIVDDKGVSWYEVQLKDEYSGAVTAFKEKVDPSENEKAIKQMFPRFYEMTRTKEEKIASGEKLSKAFQRVKSRLAEEYQNDVYYTPIKIADEMAKAFERIAEIFRTAPAETGLD